MKTYRQKIWSWIPLAVSSKNPLWRLGDPFRQNTAKGGSTSMRENSGKLLLYFSSTNIIQKKKNEETISPSSLSLLQHSILWPILFVKLSEPWEGTFKTGIRLLLKKVAFFQLPKEKKGLFPVWLHREIYKAKDLWPSYGCHGPSNLWPSYRCHGRSLSFIWETSHNSTDVCSIIKIIVYKTYGVVLVLFIKNCWSCHCRDSMKEGSAYSVQSIEII